MTHMLVASDLTSKSIYPLERAMQLREQSGALVTVLHVVEPGFTSYLEERRRLDALTVLQEWRGALPEAERQGVTVAVMVGDPFATIVEEAASRQMDLVVVGHPSKSSLRELFLGTTAERVVRFGDHPVLMVDQHANGGYKRVLVAMDLSQGGRRALEWACHIAPDAEVRIVHAWQSPLINFSRNDDAGLATANERLRHQEEQQLKALVAELSLKNRVLKKSLSGLESGFSEDQ